MFALCSSPPCSVPHVEYITGLLCPLISCGFRNGRNGGRRVRSIHVFMWLLHCGVATIWLHPCLEGHNSYQAPSSQRSCFLWVLVPHLSLCPFRPRRDDDTHWCWPGAPYPLSQFCYIFSHSCVNWSFIKPSLYYPNLRVLSPPGVLMGVGTSVRYVQLLYHPADEEMEKQKG